MALPLDEHHERDRADERLAVSLVGSGLATPGAIERARALAGPGDALHLVLIRVGLVPEREIATALAAILDLPVVDKALYPASPVSSDRLSAAFLRQAAVMPLAETDDAITLAMVDPLDRFARRAVRAATGKRVLPCVALPTELEQATTNAYGEHREGGIEQTAAADLEEDVARLRDRASEEPIIRLANQLFDRAVAAGASDVHIEPMADRLSVRLRVDGVLRELEPPPRSVHLPLLSRIKLMASLDIAERRLPQDGGARIVSGGREFDLRIATMPTANGESMVVRLLDRAQGAVALDALGFAANDLRAIEDILRQPNGIMLVTGPTGSGKTTTLYAAMQAIDRTALKVMSVEDPVEYSLDGVTQVQVKPAIGLDFAKVLRATLRHDPDVIMVGEIRDGETAEVAVQAALTGHLVLSTLHTNSAAATITRLLDMGIADYLLTATISGVVAQRLVRMLCRHCRRPVAARAAAPGGVAPANVFLPDGCEHCGGTGYRGRTALTEVLTMSEPLRRLVIERASTAAIEAAAVAAGMRSLYQDGIEKVSAGVTTLEEVLRVGRES